MDMNRSLFAALQLEKLALFVIVTIIVLVAAFAIIGHLVLLVADKRKEIGVLKAIGASRQSITATFFAVGMTIGVGGTVAGSAVGLLIIWAQNTYKVIRLASDVYQIDYLPMKLTLSDGLMVVGATLFLSFLDDRPGAPRGRARAGGRPALRMTPRAPHVRSGAGSHLVSGRLTQARLARRTRRGFAPPPIAPGARLPLRRS